jgi:uncharacterized protein YxjI
MNTEAAWLADPTHRHQLRYWDGTRWTEHVSDQGNTSLDPIDGLDRFDAALTVGAEDDPVRVAAQVTGTGYSGAGLSGAQTGGGTLFTEPVLVVNQKAKLIELAAQYGIFDSAGKRLGTVNQTGQSALKKAVRLVFDIDQYLTHHYEVRDPNGALVLQLVRPRKILRSNILVNDATGAEIGRISQENVIGKINFGLLIGGNRVGAIKAENWRAWNFRIEDAAGSEIARITKTWEGLAKTMFTTADNYVVQIHGAVSQPLLSLVVAAAVSIDTALKQDQRGLN